MRGWGALGRVGLLGALALAASVPAAAQDARVSFHVATKPMAEALIDFATQAQLSIGATGIDFRGTRSHAVEGAYTPDQALRIMLAGSGFTFEFVDASTVRIRAAADRRAEVRHEGPVERIIVTATKRESVAQTLPYSIVVVGGTEIDDADSRSTHDLTGRVAGLTETNLGDGQDKLFVRGLTDSVLPGVSESIVGVYFDEARITDDAPPPSLRLVDVERVEVLRGPQGSLYGAGSLTGLVRIISRKPVLDAFEMSMRSTASLTEGGGPSAGFETVLNLPLVTDALALRVAGYTETDGGYVNDVRLGKSDTNRTLTTGGRAALAWSPDAVWTVVASVAVQHVDARDSQYYELDLAPQDRSIRLKEPHSDQFLLADVVATAHFGWADFVTSSSFLDRRIGVRYDASSAWHDLSGFAAGAAPFDYARKIRSYAEEARLTSPDGGRFKWLVGVFVSHRDEIFHSNLTGPDAAGDGVLARMEQRDDKADEYAAFGEASYALTPALSIGAGARLFHAWHRVDADVGGFLAGPPDAFDDSTSQSGAMPKLVLSYRPDEDTTLYAQFAEGYRLGGLNVNGPPNATDEFEHAFDGDLLRNFEVGAKLRLFDARLTTNIAAYYVLWSNVQTDQIGSDGTFFILNAGDVRDYGMEADVTARPLAGVSLGAHMFWNKATLSNSDPTLAASEGVLPGAPDFGVGLSGRYDVAIDDAVSAFLGADYSYVGESHLGFNERTPLMGKYHIVNVRAGVERADWRIAVFVDNLTASDGNTFAFGNPFHPGDSPQATTPRPRTIGMSLTWSLDEAGR